MLILEDDTFMRKLVKLQVPSHAQCDEASTLAEAMAFFRKYTYNLVLVDLHLQDASGFDFLEVINRTPGKKPRVIVLTASTQESEEAKCHELAITEFVQKPFRPLALRAQLEKNLVSRKSEADEHKVLGPLRIYHRKSQVKLIAHPKDEDLLLTSKEYMLLMKFLESPGATITREQLFREVWDTSSAIQSRTVDMHVSALRKKLGNYGEAISSVRGQGYRFIRERLFSGSAS
jgi:DNA-binding response OmpR family regulator